MEFEHEEEIQSSMNNILRGLLFLGQNVMLSTRFEKLIRHPDLYEEVIGKEGD
jgi:hypothetical protein